MRNWLWRKGIAREVNNVRNSHSDRGSAMVDTAGPAWLGGPLWRYTLRPRSIDRGSFRVVDHWVLSTGKHRWKVEFRWVR